MKKYNIYMEYDRYGNNDVIYQGKSCYGSGKYDDIIITNKGIEIKGERGNNIKLENVITNISSTLYRQLLRCIVYVYLTEGKHFNIGSLYISDESNFKEYKGSELDNPCISDLPLNLLISKNECMRVFDGSEKSDELVTAMILFIKGYESNSYEYLWKAFNSLYTCISLNDKEFEKLKDMKKFIENNRGSFLRTIKLIENDEENDIRALRIREFVLDNFDDIATTAAYADMVKSFKDYRMNELFKEIMPYREEFLKSKSLLGDLEIHIENCISTKYKDDIELIRFYVLKYGYFLRNKYFHAEKSSPVFMIKRNNELEELNKMNNIMLCFLSDLFNCNSLF